MNIFDDIDIRSSKTILQGTVKLRKARQAEKEVGRQHQGTDRPGVHQITGGSGEQRKMEETGCEVICDAPTTPWLWYK